MTTRLFKRSSCQHRKLTLVVGSSVQIGVTNSYIVLVQYPERKVIGWEFYAFFPSLTWPIFTNTVKYCIKRSIKLLFLDCCEFVVSPSNYALRFLSQTML